MNAETLSNTLRSEPAGRALGQSLAGAVGGGLLIASLEFAGLLEASALPLLEQPAWLARLAAHWIIAALPLGLAIGVVEHSARGRNPSTGAYAIAIIMGTALSALVLALHGKFVDPTISKTAVGFDMELPDRFLYGFWLFAFWGSAGAVLHASSFRQKRALMALQAGELARLRGERELSEARLAALNAQVEPEFVVTTLDTVERLYERDAAASDRVLDALIRFLRQASPLLRARESTLIQECRLVEAYTSVIGVVVSAHPTVNLEIDDRIATTRLPPGILLSCVQALLSPATLAGNRTVIEIRTAADAACRSVSVSASETEIDDATVQAVATRIEHRLRMVCGARSTLEIHRQTQHGLTLRIALPTEGNQP